MVFPDFKRMRIRCEMTEVGASVMMRTVPSVAATAWSSIGDVPVMRTGFSIAIRAVDAALQCGLRPS
jgi:hypothetical protein